MKRKNIIFVLLLIMIISYITPVNACPFTFNDYKKTGEKHSFVVGDYVFDLSSGFSPSLEDFAIAARTIPDNQDEYVYEITYIPELDLYDQLEIFSNKMSNNSSDWPKFFDTTYNYRTSINIKDSDYDVFTCKTNDIKVYYSLLNTKGEGDYKVEANRIIDIQSTANLGSAKYCLTTDNECNPNVDIEVAGTSSTATINYETNKLPQHVCTEAYDTAGNTSGIVCDNVMVKVDSNPIKIEPTNEYNSIIEGSPHTVQGLFDIEFSVSNGNIYYFYYDNDNKYILSNLADLPSGDITVEAIGRSGSGLISENDRVINVRKNIVSYDYQTNGGTSASKTMADVEFGGRADLRVTAEKSGYEFVGWNTDKDANYALETLEVDKDITLYAIFKKELNVDFEIYNKENNLPAVAEYETTTCTIYNNEIECEVIVPTIQARVGYEALGWSKEKDKTAEYVGGETIKISSDDKLYSVTRYLVPNTATFITLKDGEITKDIRSCYLYNGDSSCEIDITNISSDDYNGRDFIGFSSTPDHVTPVEKITIDKGMNYYAYYQDRYSVNFVSDDSHVETIDARIEFIVNEDKVIANAEEITIPTPISKNNYEIVGWTDDVDGFVSTIHPGDKMPIEKNNTYNAIYSKEITIHYESTNDTTNIPHDQKENLYYNAGSKRAQPAVINLDSGLSISRNGYIFNGWTSEGKRYQQGTPQSFEKNMTFTAEWTENATLVIFDYKTNGGSSVTIGSATYQHGISNPIDVTKSVAYKRGYNFVGWSTQAGAEASTMTEFVPEEGKEQVTLYAIFSRNLTIRYNNINQSILTIDGADTERYTIYNNSPGKEIILPDVSSNNPNIEFLGWSTSPGSIKVEYTSGDRVTIKENTTFYTIIRNNTEYVSTYVYYDGNRRLTEKVSCKLFNDDVTCKTEFNPNVKYNEAIMTGWSTDPNTVILSDEQVINTSSTFYAVYSKQAVVKYYSGLNTDSNAPSSTSTIVGVSYLTTTNNIKPIAKDVILENPDGIAGFTTLGWRSDKKTDVAVYYNRSILPVTDNIDLYAVYSKSVSLSYAALGGSPTPTTQTNTIRYNTGIKNPANETRFTVGAAPSKTGQELDAWLLENNNNERYQPGETIILTSNAKLYAKYRAKKYRITLNGEANGGLNPTNNVITLNYGEMFNLKNYSAQTNKSGYTFMGWSLEPNSREIINEYKVPSENTTLYAVYKKTLTANWIMYDTKAGTSDKASTTCDIYNNETTCYAQAGSMTMNNGYSAVGWSKTRGSTDINAGIGLSTPITRDTDFYSITKRTQDLVGTFYYFNNSNVVNVSTSCGLYNGAESCTISAPSNPANHLSTAFSAWSSTTNKYTAASLNISAKTDYYAYYRQITELNYNSGLFSNEVAASKSTETYTVEYIANKSGGWSSVPTTTLKSPAAITNFNILGWREDTSLTTQTYNVNTQVSMQRSYDLYAVYNRTITLSYDLQGGTPARANQTQTQYYNSGAGKTSHTFTLAEAVAKTGYTFQNWKLNSLEGTAYNAQSQINIIEDSKMYANLTLNSYQVNLSVGSGGSASASSINVYYGLTNTFTVTPNAGYYLESLSCDNGYTASGFTTGTSSTGTQTITISNNNKLNGATCTIKFKVLCPYEIGHVWTYNYNGGVQQFKTECTGTYKLEVWGAQGGTISGGYGGYSYGSVSLNRNTTIYVVVGNQPSGEEGGYNGGGSAGDDPDRGAGGGATHIGKTNSILEYTSVSNLLIVAGGGGGGTVNSGAYQTAAIGGAGGGSIGGTGGNSGACTGIGKDCFERLATGGSQNSGGLGGIGRDDWLNTYNGKNGSYGKGANGSTWMTGGGGGYYGGGSGAVTGNYTNGGGGGSGYIGGVTDGNMKNGQRQGNGYAKITLLSIT